MDQKKFISVIVPTYNSEKYIQKCISSVLHQKYQDFEIIVVDNHSTDNTLNIIKSFNSDKIKIFSVVNNGNISVSRNLGINHSTGSWIAFLDSDDFWERDKLILLSKQFENFDFIYHNMNIIRNKKVFKNSNFLLLKKDNNYFSLTENLCTKGNPIINSSVIVKKDILLKVDLISEDQSSLTNDYHTWLKISLITNKFYYEKRKLGTYVLHDQNYSHGAKNSYYYLKCVLDFKKYLSDKAKKKIIGYYYYEKGKDLNKIEQNSEALKCYFKSFLLSDLDIKIKSLINILFCILKKLRMN